MKRGNEPVMAYIKLKEYTFWMVNRASDKAFQVTIKGKDEEDAIKKAKVKFPYPKYEFETNLNKTAPI